MKIHQKELKSGKHIAIPTTHIGKYQITLNDLSTFVLLIRIFYWILAQYRLMKDYWTETLKNTTKNLERL